MSNIQQNIEDKTFKGLIKKYAKKRMWEQLRATFEVYGFVLEERDKESETAK